MSSRPRPARLEALSLLEHCGGALLAEETRVPLEGIPGCRDEDERPQPWIAALGGRVERRVGAEAMGDDRDRLDPAPGQLVHGGEQIPAPLLEQRRLGPRVMVAQIQSEGGEASLGQGGSEVARDA
jgi:hypothetical protein